MKEEWKDVPLYNGLYKVSNLGRVMSLYKHNGTTERILRQRINKFGYCFVGLYYPKHKRATTFTVHQLVATCFIPNPNRYTQVNHIDGNKSNNCISNLKWCDSRENNLHRIYTLHKSGGIPSPRKIKCVETEKLYRSIKEAQYELKAGGIYKVIDKPNRTCCGYHWISV